MKRSKHHTSTLASVTAAVRRQKEDPTTSSAIASLDLFGARRQQRSQTRQREAQSTDEASHEDASDASALLAIPNDTYAAIRYLLGRWPAAACEIPRAILRHQLYTVVSNRTTVDRELSVLRDQGHVRVFRLGLSVDELVVMLPDEYASVLRAQLASLDDETEKATVRMFIDRIATHERGVSIERGRLASEYGVATDSQLSTLVRVGALVLRHETSYFFSFPCAGRLMGNYSKGREEMLALVRKTRYREMLQRDLLQRKLKKSVLGVPFHIDDLVGSERLDIAETGLGRLLRIPR